MRRPIAGWATLAACGLLISGCGGFSGSGTGFGGFGAARAPAVPAGSYTHERLRGGADSLQPLEIDTSLQWPRDPLERASIFETEEDRRARERQVRRPPGTPAPAPSPRADRQDPADLVDRAPPRAVATPEPDRRGQAIPGAPPGTVTTGGTGRTGTFGGPAGSGTTVRDGGTMTLMGADGQIRTVPAPR
jgi:hypothetical protein